MSSDPTRDRLAHEVTGLRAQRQRLAAQLGGEDPDDPDLGDRGDEAVQLEGLDDLARLDRRIAEVERLLAQPPTSSGWPEGTVVTLRFPDGAVATFRIVAIPDDDEDEVTSDSPLGRALAERAAGDTVGWRGPDGDMQAVVDEVRLP
jgi:transcription elongation factor GreA